MTLMGEDTDLLVLLLFYYDLDAQNLYYRSGKSVKSYDRRRAVVKGVEHISTTL